jgi:hypothetical protein
MIGHIMVHLGVGAHIIITMAIMAIIMGIRIIIITIMDIMEDETMAI